MACYGVTFTFTLVIKAKMSTEALLQNGTAKALGLIEPITSA
jgi:hypothetical protein